MPLDQARCHQVVMLAGLAGGLAASLAAVAVATAVAEEALKERPCRRCCHRRRRPGQKLFWYSCRLWSLRRWDDETCQVYCRFSKEEICCLVDLLSVSSCPWTNRYTLDKELVFCLLLKRLAYPGKLVDIASLFGKSLSWCSTVFNDLATFLFVEYHSLLEWHPQLDDYNCLACFAESISDLAERRDGGEGGLVAGEGSVCFWGFVDSTFCRFCCPTGQKQQRAFYSGYKKDTGQKWQGIVTPDSLVSLLIEPFLSPVNDWAVFQRSAVEEKIRDVMGGYPLLYLYRDPAYQAFYGVMTPFKHPCGCHALPAYQKNFNKRLSAARIAVEHTFGYTQVL
jgi:nuclease HARBI1